MGKHSLLEKSEFNKMRSVSGFYVFTLAVQFQETDSINRTISSQSIVGSADDKTSSKASQNNFFYDNCKGFKTTVQRILSAIAEFEEKNQGKNLLLKRIEDIKQINDFLLQTITSLSIDRVNDRKIKFNIGGKNNDLKRSFQ
jgi:hypothetical protein